jgi:hypothetical protein
MLPHERAAAIAAKARERAAPARERNRRAMPEIAAWLDGITAVFGKPVAGVVTEGGRTVRWGTPVAYSYAVQASAHPKPTKRKRGASDPRI